LVSKTVSKTGVGVQHGGLAIIMDPIAAGSVCAFCVTIIGWCGASGDAGEIRKTAPQAMGLFLRRLAHLAAPVPGRGFLFQPPDFLLVVGIGDQDHS